MFKRITVLSAATLALSASLATAAEIKLVSRLVSSVY
jgi:hypothetical protein